MLLLAFENIRNRG